MHDLAVIGLGLIGSAVARHAAVAGADVVAVGPAEPAHWASHDGPFASHYDSGRITRRLDARWEWAELAARAIAHYHIIEAASGIEFHHPVGLVFVRDDTEGIGYLQEVADQQAIPIERSVLGPAGSEVPHLRFPPGWTVFAEGAPAGFIDPRRMVEAQHRAAAGGGADIRRDVVTEVTRRHGGFRLALGSGAPSIEAERVVIATGSYGNDLLGDGLGEPLAMVVRAEAVVLAEVSDDEAARLAAMPSTIYLVDDSEVEGVYTVPATRYPDGRSYIKLGASQLDNVPLADVDARHRWMRGTDADRLLPAMRRVFGDMMPDVDVRSWTMKPCLLTDTASGLPYIDHVADGLVVAIGGNGHAAKSADAVGALAADLALSGRWRDDGLPAEAFRARTGAFDWTGPRLGRHRR